MGKGVDKTRPFVYRGDVLNRAAEPIDTPGTKFYSPEDVAKLLHVHHRTVRTWIRQGDLKAVRPGGKLLRITDADLTAFISKKAPE
jgi:excisionase family DNA binding protein